MTDMTQNEIERARHAIGGYYSPPRGDSGSRKIEAAFEDARAECLGHYMRTIKNIEALTIKQMFPKYRP